MVDRADGPGRPRLEEGASGAPGLVPETIVQLAQPDPPVGGRQVARRSNTGTEAGQGPGVTDELLGRRPRRSLVPPGRVVGMAQLPPPPGGPRTSNPPGTVGDDTGFLRHPPALEAGPVGRQPRLQIVTARTVEAPTVGVAERVDAPVPVATSRHRTGAGSPEHGPRGPGTTSRSRWASHSSANQRSSISEATRSIRQSAGACRGNDHRQVNQRTGCASAHRTPPAPRPWASTAARMSAQRECR